MTFLTGFLPADLICYIIIIIIIIIIPVLGLGFAESQSRRSAGYCLSGYNWQILIVGSTNSTKGILRLVVTGNVKCRSTE